MSKNLKTFLGISYLIILIAFLYFIFTSIEISKLNDFLYYKELQKDLSNFVSESIIANLIYFFIFAVLWVALLGFGAPLLIISGILFGQWIGTLISVISISVGALILYSIGNFFFRDLVKKILQQKFDKYIFLFKKNEFYYFLRLRFYNFLIVYPPKNRIFKNIFKNEFPHFGTGDPPDHPGPDGRTPPDHPGRTDGQEKL